MSELKPCPLCHSKEVSICYDLKRNGDVACFICGCSADINAWDQRQPHPDTVMLDWMIEHSAEVHESGFGYSVRYTPTDLRYPLHVCTGHYVSPRQAIQQAMEEG